MVEKQSADAPRTQEDRNFAYNLKRLREERGLSQGEFARRVTARGLEGFHQTTISRIEKGERLVRLGEARVIAMVLDRKVDMMTLPKEDVTLLDRMQTSLEEATGAQANISRAVGLHLSHLQDVAMKLELILEKRESVTDDLMTQMDLDRMIRSAKKLLAVDPVKLADVVVRQERRSEANRYWPVFDDPSITYGWHHGEHQEEG